MKRLLKILSNFGKQIREDNISSYASSCAFFIFLSLIPLIMLLFAILPYTPVDSGVLSEIVLNEFPLGTGSMLISILEEVSMRSAGLVSVTAIAMLWSAGKGINSLILGLNAIDRNADKRNGLLVRILASFYTLVFLIGLVILLILVVGGNFIKGLLFENFPNLSNVFNVLMNFRSLISIVLMTVVVCLCYALLPYKKHKLRVEFPGGVVSSLAWTGFSYLFSFYVDRFNAFAMYGSFTTIIILMVWLYFGMFILFLGHNLNRYFRPVILAFHEEKNLKSIKGQLESLEED
ncbi:MAG: YihY/virulence factor BrkB family protein [Lachnospiraceae bacterium]|nr:YihY/virulence factor BrkB family protein [Lachnospiraceae bacterium]